MAKVATILGDYDSAITKLKELLNILRMIGDLFEQTATLCWLAEAYETADNLTEALSLYQECQSIAEKLEFPFWQWQALFGQGRCLQQLGKNKEAISKLSGSCAIIVKLRKQFASEQEGANFVAETQVVYDLLTNLTV